MPRLSLGPCIACLALTLLFSRGASGEEPSRENAAAPVAPVASPSLSGGLRARLPAWMALEEVGAPDPPIFRGEVGAIVWPVVRTTIRIGRRGGDPGTELDGEAALGLPRFGASPYFEASAGTRFRFGVDFLDLDRDERFRRVYQTVDARGIVLAQPLGLVASHFHYTQASAWVEWDALYGATYRIGLVGGARYLRIGARLEGLQSNGFVVSVSDQDNVVSPFFGGQIELVPVETFSVFASIRFIDWAWAAVALREQRTFTSRLGCSVSFLDGLLGIALDFRFLSSSLDSGGESSANRTRGRYEIDAAGIGLTLTLKL